LKESVTANADLGAGRRELRGFFGRDLLYVFLWAAQLGLATLLTPVITRLLGTHGYGFAAVCVALMQLLISIAGFGLNVAIQRVYASDGDSEARKIVTVSLLLAMGSFWLLTVSGPLWAHALQLGPYRGAVPYTVAWAMTAAVCQTVLGVLRSRDQLGRFALITLMQTTLSEALSLALVLMVRRTANEYILGELIGQGATLVVGLMLTRPVLLRGVDRQLVAAALRFAIPLIPVTLSGFVLSSAARLVLNADVGRVSAARFTIASNVGSIASLLVYAVFETWMPRVFALRDQDTVPQVLGQSRDTLYALLIPATIGLCVASPLLLRLWAPSSFAPDHLQIYVAIVCVSTFPYAGATTNNRSLMRASRTQIAARITIGAASVSIALSLLLVPLLGIAGATLSALVAYGVMYVRSERISQRLLPVPRTSTRLLAEIGLAVAICFAALLIPVTLPFLIFRGVVGLCSAIAVAAILYVVRKPPSNPLLVILSRWLTLRAGLA
jgi:O-antigen/teichoic acid export membrane protein